MKRALWIFGLAATRPLSVNSPMTAAPEEGPSPSRGACNILKLTRSVPLGFSTSRQTDSLGSVREAHTGRTVTSAPLRVLR